MNAGAAVFAACCVVIACTDAAPPPRAGTPADTNAAIGVPAAACYRSDGPILTRLAPAPDESTVVGWLRIDEPWNAGGGPAQLVETGGASLGARWTRRGDTLVLDGANDFLRLTARLLEEGGRLRGEAHLSSDAQLEPGPGGALVPAERRWRLVADSAACDGAPQPWHATRQVAFDPARLRRGDTVGQFRAERVAIVRAETIDEWTGSVTFAGRVWVSGMAIRHFDYPEVRSSCFEADPVSAQQLPRWPGDERRPWFCFENDSTGRRLLGAPDSLGRAEVLIDRFTTVRSFTDAVNSARLVAVRAPR